MLSTQALARREPRLAVCAGAWIIRTLVAEGPGLSSLGVGGTILHRLHVLACPVPCCDVGPQALVGTNRVYVSVASMAHLRNLQHPRASDSVLVSASWLLCGM
jgi:hypothetical protein